MNRQKFVPGAAPVAAAALAALVTLGAIVAAAPISRAAADKDGHPFAKHHIVVQISDGDPGKQQLVLNNVNNLMQEYTPEEVQLEVVAYGPGLGLLRKDNTHAAAIADLVKKYGVEFAACHNTMKAQHLTEADINPASTVVPAGVVEIVTREEQGWSYIRP